MSDTLQEQEDRKERYLLKADHQTEWDEVTKEQFIAAEQAAGFHSQFGPNHLATGGFSGCGIRGRIEYVNQQPPSNPGWCSECQGYPPHMPWCAKSTTSSGNQLKTTEHEPAARGEGERVILNSDLVVQPLPNTTKFLLVTEDDWPIAEFYKEEEAAGIAYEHNSYHSLREQNGRLWEALGEMLNRFYPHTCDRGPLCAKCGALTAASAIFREKEPVEAAQTTKKVSEQ